MSRIIFSSLIMLLGIFFEGCDNPMESQNIHDCLDSQACNYSANIEPPIINPFKENMESSEK